MILVLRNERVWSSARRISGHSQVPSVRLGLGPIRATRGCALAFLAHIRFPPGASLFPEWFPPPFCPWKPVPKDMNRVGVLDTVEAPCDHEMRELERRDTQDFLMQMVWNSWFCTPSAFSRHCRLGCWTVQQAGSIQIALRRCTNRLSFAAINWYAQFMSGYL